MDTLYVIPTDCPRENLYAVSKAWEVGAIKQSIFEAITPREGYSPGRPHSGTAPLGSSS
jgi:hypothetical protein